jgi:hypothetical protein
MIIVASGPSAVGFEPPPDIPVICVNGVIQWISRADYWFALDGTPRNLRRCHVPRPGVKYVVALPKHYRTPEHVIRYERVALGNSPGLSTDPKVIHSGNSAFGALGLAYHLGAKKVMLVGVDANTRRRIEGGYSGDLSHLPSLFESAVGQIEMVCGGGMRAEGIPRISIMEGLKWLRQ